MLKSPKCAEIHVGHSYYTETHVPRPLAIRRTQLCLSTEENVKPKLRYLRTRFELDDALTIGPHSDHGNDSFRRRFFGSLEASFGHFLQIFSDIFADETPFLGLFDKGVRDVRRERIQLALEFLYETW